MAVAIDELLTALMDCLTINESQSSVARHIATMVNAPSNLRGVTLVPSPQLGLQWESSLQASLRATLRVEVQTDGCFAVDYAFVSRSSSAIHGDRVHFDNNDASAGYGLLRSLGRRLFPADNNAGGAASAALDK